MVKVKNLRAVSIVRTGHVCSGGSVLRGTAALVCSWLSLCVIAVDAGATATTGEPPHPGPTGLPDERVFEQVSPTNKHGNYYSSNIMFGLASRDGDAVVYPMTGPVGDEASSGLITEFASKRTPAHGWHTASTTSLAKAHVEVFDAPLTMVPSADFTRFAFTSFVPWVAEQHEQLGVDIYLSRGPFVEEEWLGKPQIPNPFPRVGQVSLRQFGISGASPSLDTVYFRYAGTLVPEDASRSQYADGPETQKKRKDPAEGFYEWHEGTLVSAGALPDGSYNPFGSVPAGFAGESNFARRFIGVQQANTIDNQVSEDGTRAFFVSPDPVASTVTDSLACTNQPPCSAEPPELYLRKPDPSGKKVSVLVSGSQLPAHEGEAAPTGVASMPTSIPTGGPVKETDVYASADGSHAFFASDDQLTSAAPADTQLKLYDFDTATGGLTYLPGVTPPLVTVSHDGSGVLFEDRTSTPYQLKLWKSGSNGGSVTTISELSSQEIDEAHFSEDGSVVVFRTEDSMGGAFNSGSYKQVYRFDLFSNALNCLSCPGHGLTPSAETRMSYNNDDSVKANGLNGTPATTIETRAISADGSRVFFDTPSALVPQDTNGVRDVYEWEKGTVYLISSGSSPEESFYLDNDFAGENVFFATTSGLVPSDSDQAFDVYDARVPRVGDNPPSSAVPCKGAVCQGPPSEPQLLGQPASETFDGAGNLAPPPTHAKSRSLTRKQKLARALRACRRRGRPGARAKCERQAQRRYGAKAADVRPGVDSHGNGRGK